MDTGRIRRNAIEALTQVPEVKAQSREVAREIQKLAKRKAPRGATGNLRRSIKVTSAFKAGIAFYRVGWDKGIAFYGPLVELGTMKTRAQPHLRPAADEVKGRRG